MFSVIAVVNGVETLVENYDDCLSAVNDTLEHWNEEEGGATFYVKNEAGTVVITMVKPEDNPERAVVIYANGKIDVMKCTYILDDTGRYLSTDIGFVEQVL